jgi:hypothetical protein
MSFDLHPACADVTIENRTTADVVVQPRRKKVAIVGFASNTLHLVPWFDPSFEIWTMNQGHMHALRRSDRHWEMHMPEATADVRDPEYLAWLEQCPVPVYMIDTRDEIPNSVRFPIEEAIKYGGRDYFMSSPAFMLALAGMEGFEEIHLYGINLAIGDEYFYEKPNCEWWIGQLQGKGIKVYIPAASSLLKQFRRYGYSIDARPAASLKLLLQARINEYRQREEKLIADISTIRGAKLESEALLQIAEGIDHGADVVLMPPQKAPVPLPQST